MNQVLLGGLIPFALAALYYARRGGRATLRMLVAVPLLMAFGAVWAVVPDIPRLLGWHRLYERLAHDPRTDLFLWHYTIDRCEIGSVWYTVGFVILATGLLAAAWRELYLREREERGRG